MLKKWLSLLLAGAMVFSLTACGPKQEAAPAEPAAPANEELSGTITIWSWDVAAKSLSESAENFKKIHPKVEFVIEDLGTDQVYDKLTTGLSANVGLPDIVSIEGERVAGFAAKFPQGFVDMTGVINAEDFLKVKVSECTVNGKLVALPWDGAPCALYYRTDYFEKAGIKAEDIKTWDDLIVAGKKMNAIGVKMLPTAISKRSTMYEFLLSQQNLSVFNAEGKTDFGSDASVKAMAMVKKMYDAGIIYDSVNWDGLVTATKEGKVATVASAVWWAGTMKDEVQESSGKWAVMRLPALEAGGITAATNGGSNIMVPASSANKAAAVEFAKFAMTDQPSLINGFSKYGLYPSYIPSYADPIFEKEEPYFGNQKIWKLFAEIGQEIPAIHYNENLQEVTDMLINAQAKVLLKNGDVKATLDELQKNVTDKLGQ